MVEDLLAGKPAVGISHKKLGDEVFGLLGDVLPESGGEAPVASFDRVELFLLVLSEEGEVSTEAVVDDHSHAPAVHLTVVLLLVDDLGGWVQIQ